MGLAPILAGRNAAKVNAVAEELGLEACIFPVAAPAAIDDALDQGKAVLSCAGPYLYTFRAITDSCLRTQTHYLDITGKIPVL